MSGVQQVFELAEFCTGKNAAEITQALCSLGNDGSMVGGIKRVLLVGFKQGYSAGFRRGVLAGFELGKQSGMWKGALIGLVVGGVGATAVYIVKDIGGKHQAIVIEETRITEEVKERSSDIPDACDTAHSCESVPTDETAEQAGPDESDNTAQGTEELLSVSS